MARQLLVNSLNRCSERKLPETPLYMDGSARVVTDHSNQIEAWAGPFVQPKASAPPSHPIGRELMLGGILRRLQPSPCLILFLALTFLLLCPLWAYFSICGLGMPDNGGQGCFLYSFVFDMPVWLPPLAILLIILASLWLIAAARQSPVFRAVSYSVLARAPPLS